MEIKIQTLSNKMQYISYTQNVGIIYDVYVYLIIYFNKSNKVTSFAYFKTGNVNAAQA